MPTFDVQETFRSDVEVSMDDDGYVTSSASRKLTVLSSTASTPVQVRLFAIALPREGDPHPETLQLYCNKVKIQPRGNTNILFDVDVSYTSRKSKQGEDPVQPYELPVEITWKSLTASYAVDEDRNGDPIAIPNTNEPIEGVTREVTDIVGVFKKNYAGFDPAAIYLYNNTVNSDTFLGFSPGTGMVKNIEATLGIGADLVYWAVTVEIHFRVAYRTTAAKAWYSRVKCQGFEEWNTTLSKKVRCMDGENTPSASPCLLSATDGTRLQPSDPAEWLEFDTTNGTQAFSSMGIL